VTRIEPLTAWEKSAHMKVQGTEVGLVGGQPTLATHFHVYVYTNTLIVLLVLSCLVFSELAMITNVNDKSNHSNQNNTNIQDQRIHRPLGNPPIRRGTDIKVRDTTGTTMGGDNTCKDNGPISGFGDPARQQMSIGGNYHLLPPHVLISCSAYASFVKEGGQKCLVCKS
jgi:hypothetical protein